MVTIDGVSYQGNNLLIDHSGTYIDGVPIEECVITSSTNSYGIGSIIILSLILWTILFVVYKMVVR